MELKDIPTDGFVGLLGLTLGEVGPDRVTATLEIRADLHQPYGILHGGVLCAIVETVASVAGAMWFGDRGKVVGSSNTTNFLRATREGVLTAVALPIHRGRSQQLWEVDITDEQDRLVAKGQVRLANLPDAAQAP